MSRENFVWYSVQSPLIFKEFWLPREQDDRNSVEQRQYERLVSLAKSYETDVKASDNQPGR